MTFFIRIEAEFTQNLKKKPFGLHILIPNPQEIENLRLVLIKFFCGNNLHDIRFDRVEKHE